MASGTFEGSRFGIVALIAWVYSIFVGLAGIAGIITGDVLTGSLFLISAIIACPPPADYLRRRFNIVTPRWLRAVGALAVLLVAGATIQPTKSPTMADTSAVKTSTANSSGPTRAEFAVLITDTEFGLVIGGRTNLPSGTQMIVSIERGAALQGQDDATVGDGGKFYAGPFSDGKEKLRPGKYTVEINSGMVDVQPDDVKRAAGTNWSNFTGPLIQKAVAELPGSSVVSATIPFRYSYNRGGAPLSQSVQPNGASISFPNFGWLKTGIANRVVARERAYDSEKGGAFSACQIYIKRDLRDPDSADFVTDYAPDYVTAPSNNLSEYRVLQKVRAANGFGGKTISLFRCDLHLDRGNWILDNIKESILD